ncbi:MAG: hypothetical protein J7507_05615 [Pseudoxanthomonas sp.]|nr:hypothetical protein [Pseudoxanthomonas sp.]
MNPSKDRAPGARSALALIALLLIPAAWGAPKELEIRTKGQFDANLILTGSFTATGAINAQGTIADSPRFKGQSIHINRTMTTADGETILLAINSNHVVGTNTHEADWCPRPETVPPGTELFPEVGNWTAKGGTGKYAALKGTGKWASWVVRDPNSRPLTAQECFSGQVQLD